MTTPPVVPAVFGGYLAELLAEADAEARRLAATDPGRRAAVAAAARRESARLSARLDGSPLDEAVAAGVDAREERGEPLVEATADPASARRSGTWAGVLKLDDLPTEEIAAVEYANLLACFDAEAELAASFLDRPREGLDVLHAAVCRGLVATETLGRLRRTDQAVHDGAQGSVIFHAADPATIPDRLGALTDWLHGAGRSLPPVVVAGGLQERLLEIQPFEAGNGRVARAASRTVLRARAVDPEGAAVVERLLAADPAGYHAEVAATKRRRGDLAVWLERYVEAAVAGLASAATAAGALAPPPPDRALRRCAALAGGEAVTVAEYAAAVDVDVATARRDLRALARTGALAPTPRSRGLRYVRAGDDPRCPAGQG